MSKQKHFAGTLKSLIKKHDLTIRAFDEAVGIPSSTIVRLYQSEYRCDRIILEKLGRFFKGQDHADLVQAHALDEIGESGLKILTKKSPSTPALMPQTFEAIGQLNRLPEKQREAAERALSEVIMLFTSVAT